MKNLKIAFLALAIATAFAACKGKEEAASDSPAMDSPAADTAAKDTAAKM
jgi:hypothetical protein